MNYPWAKLGQFGVGGDWCSFENLCRFWLKNKNDFPAHALLYSRSWVKPMGEAILRYLSSLATLGEKDGSTAMIAEDANILDFAAVALIVVFVTAKITNSNYGRFIKSLLAGRTLRNNRTTDRMFEMAHIQALKKCPNCTEQLPLSTLICEACDYNFITGLVAHGHKLLPSPEPMAHEMSERSFA